MSSRLPWQKKEWCIPKVSAEFVANMEDLLDLYAEPYAPRRPVVCFDETSTQLSTGWVKEDILVCQCTVPCEVRKASL